MLCFSLVPLISIKEFHKLLKKMELLSKTMNLGNPWGLREIVKKIIKEILSVSTC